MKFHNLSGFTSAQGNRHALGFMEEANLKQDDASFYLIACSAFVNYLTSKSSEAGLNVSKYQVDAIISSTFSSTFFQILKYIFLF